jgi:hypothetical protein
MSEKLNYNVWLRGMGEGWSVQEAQAQQATDAMYYAGVHLDEFWPQRQVSPLFCLVLAACASTHAGCASVRVLLCMCRCMPHVPLPRLLVRGDKRNNADAQEATSLTILLSQGPQA